MLKTVDHIQLAIRDRAAAAETFTAILGAEKCGEDRVPVLNARRTLVHAGRSVFELLEPAGDGPVAEHLQARGEGIFAAGFTTSDVTALAAHLADAGVEYREEAGQLFIEPGQTRGMRTVISSYEERQPVGVVSFAYEVTNIVSDHEQAADFYADIFALDKTRFSPIASKEFGYQGTLTLFNPPEQLDRIELTQTNDTAKAMGRFYAKRGESIYMCYMEAPDVNELARRLDARGARFTGRVDDPEPNGLFIHPTALHGVLMGISRTTYAWTWSGRPDLVQPL